MTDIIHSYPFDPAGDKSGNRIVGEKHALSPPAWKDYHFIIPKLAPFFRDSLQIRDLNTGRVLQEGVDWTASHRFIQASRSTAKPIYGSISFFDKTLSGAVEIEYQTVGGDWTIDGDLIRQLLVQTSTNPRITTWEQIVDLPFQFPTIDHQWNLDDLVGMSEVKDALQGVTDTILATRDVRPIVRQHIANETNPHNVNKAQVGLGQVANHPIATRGEALTANSDEAYMTPRRTRQSIEKFGYAYTDQHEERGDNPHRVTKAQVGLGAVANHPPASEVDAQAGARNDRSMTPFRVKQAIEKIGFDYTNAHAARGDNPHDVTKAQVGLASVENYPIASKAQAEGGSHQTSYMTPLRTYQAIRSQVSEAHEQHLDDRSNPHDVTKAQVGLGSVKNYGIALDIEAEQGLVRDKYMTPRQTKIAFDAQIRDRFYTKAEMDAMVGMVSYDLPILVQHLNLKTDPHEVTKADLGLALLSNHDYVDGNYTLNVFGEQVTGLRLLVDHNRDVNPHNETLVLVDLENIDNTTLLDGSTLYALNQSLESNYL